MATIKFDTVIKKFGSNGEKTGWTYILIPSELSEQLNPGVRKSYQVKGKLDKHAFKGLSVLPMGKGDFILTLNADLRKAIKKSAGADLSVTISLDKEERTLSEDFIACLEDEPRALAYFKTLTLSHQRYFSKWIETAKTDATKVKRITMAVMALAQKQGFPEMLRANKKSKE